MNGNALPGPGQHAVSRLAAQAAVLGPAQTTPPFSPAMQHATPAMPAQGMNNWAADFARFSAQNQQNGQPVEQAHNAMNGGPVQAPGYQPPQFHQVPQAGFQSSFNGRAPLFGPTNGGFRNTALAEAQRPAAERDFQDEMDKWMAANGPENARAMEDVDAVMEQMARELELNEAILAREAEAQNTSMHATNDAHFTDLEVPEIGNLSLDSRQPLTAAVPVDDQQQLDNANTETPKVKSEVAEAAERLLESVQEEDGEKWKNSRFLSLMRDFRDGKKDIVDNEVRDTEDGKDGAGGKDGSSSAPGAASGSGVAETNA